MILSPASVEVTAPHTYVARKRLLPPLPLKANRYAVDSTSSVTHPPQALFFFDVHRSFTTCTPSLITWLYAGRSPGPPLSLNISSVDTFQTNSLTNSHTTLVAAGPSGSGMGGSMSRSIATSLDPALDRYTWEKTDVPQGWYIFTGSADIPSSPGSPNSNVYAYLFQSVPFFVSDGDTSCLTSTPPLPPSSEGNAVRAINIYALAGGVIGGILLLAVLPACIWLLRRRLSRASSAGGEKSRTTIKMPQLRPPRRGRGKRKRSLARDAQKSRPHAGLLWHEPFLSNHPPADLPLVGTGISAPLGSMSQQPITMPGAQTQGMHETSIMESLDSSIIAGYRLDIRPPPAVPLSPATASTCTANILPSHSHSPVPRTFVRLPANHHASASI